MKDSIKKYAKTLKISDTGICKARVFDELLDIFEKNNTPFVAKAQKRISPFDFVADAKSIIMCVFNYYTGEHQSNISKYAYGKDYHIVVTQKLNELCKYIKSIRDDFEGYVFCDSSPLCDKHLAHLAGLGIIGKNRLLIHPIFGSYIFIGGIVTNMEMEDDFPLEGSCLDCKKCMAACPGQALSPSSYDALKCASYLTQKKGSLTDDEKKIIKNSGKAWGCDICSDVCPHNKNVPLTDIDEFYAQNLCITDENMKDDSSFNESMRGRAFTWRGYDTIKRNFDLTKKSRNFFTFCHF